MTRHVVTRFAFIFVLASALLATAPPVSARPVEFDQATIAELNAAFEAGTLTAEKLVELCLARIAAYDRQGPKIHAIISLNPNALEIARDDGKPWGRSHQQRPLTAACKAAKIKPAIRFHDLRHTDGSTSP